MLLLHGSIAIPRPINGNMDFARLLSVWDATAPSLLPTHADDHEPVKRPFDASRPGQYVDAWRSSRLWLARRTRPSVSFSVHGALGQTNSTIHISIPGRDAPALIEMTERLVINLAEDFEADLAVVHTLCEAERLEATAARRPDVYTVNRKTGLAGMGLGFSVPTSRDGLESLYWTNFFGPRLERFFGPDALASAGWEEFERVSSGVVARVAKAPPTDDTWQAFRSRRDQIIDRLGRSAFYPEATRAPDLAPDAPVSYDIYQR
jgi:hypothetical protein